MNRFNINFITPLMVFLIVMNLSLYAAENDSQNERIKADIEVLQSVLDKLIIHDSPFLFGGGDKVKGIYLDGFGIMFDFESSGLLSLSEMIERSVRTFTLRFDSDKNPQVKVSTDQDEEYDEKAEIEKSLKKTEDLIMEFFVNYASAVKSLKDTDRICINIQNSVDDAVPSQFRACASVSDLGDFRKGKIDEKKLRSKIKIDRIYDTDKNRDLEIFEEILDKSLGRSTGPRVIDWDGNTRSMYLENFGAIFFSPVSVYDRLEHVIIRNARDIEKKAREAELKARDAELRIREHEKQIRERENRLKDSDTRLKEPALPAPPAPSAEPAKKPKHIVIHSDGDTLLTDTDFEFDFDFQNVDKPSKEELDSIITEITEKIINTLGQYGFTLRSIKTNESILIAIDISNHSWDDKTKMLYLKVKKADIERFARDEITEDKFSKTVEVWQD